MKKRICNFTNKKTLSIVAFVTLALYAIMLFVTIPKIQTATGGMTIFDLSSKGYDMAYAIKLLSAMSQDVINYYRFVQIPIDMLYPAVLGLFFFMSMCALNKKIRIYKPLYILPVLVTFFDYFENISVFILLSKGASEILVYMASFFTVMKNISVSILFILLPILVIRYIIVSRRQAKSSEQR